MVGIHQTLKEVRDLYAEALKLQEAVLSSHRELKGCVAQVEAWHESMGRLAAQVETLTVRLKNLGGLFLVLVFMLCLLAGFLGGFLALLVFRGLADERNTVIQEKKDEDGEKYLTVDTEDDWHEALRRGRRIETPVQLADEIGVPMNEDVGTLDDILAAGFPLGLAPIPFAFSGSSAPATPAGSPMSSSSRSGTVLRRGRSPGSQANASRRRISRPGGDTPPATVSI